MKMLIVGYGNPLRSDDGVGSYIATRLQELNLPQVETRCMQQLSLELIEEFPEFEHVLVVDASSEEGPIRIQTIEIAEHGKRASSHFLGVELLAGMAQKLYGASPQIHVCTIPVENMNFGSTLSPLVRARAEQAMGLITDFVKACRREPVATRS